MQDSVDEILDELGHRNIAWQPAQNTLTHRRFNRYYAHPPFDEIDGDDHSFQPGDVGPYDEFGQQGSS